MKLILRNNAWYALTFIGDEFICDPAFSLIYGDLKETARFLG